MSDAGCGYTFWSMTQQADTPEFTCPATSEPSTAQAHGGGLGIPGSKARLVGMLEELGWDTALQVVKVGNMRWFAFPYGLPFCSPMVAWRGVYSHA